MTSLDCMRWTRKSMQTHAIVYSWYLVSNKPVLLDWYDLGYRKFSKPMNKDGTHFIWVNVEFSVGVWLNADTLSWPEVCDAVGDKYYIVLYNAQDADVFRMYNPTYTKVTKERVLLSYVERFRLVKNPAHVEFLQLSHEMNKLV